MNRQSQSTIAILFLLLLSILVLPVSNIIGSASRGAVLTRKPFAATRAMSKRAGGSASKSAAPDLMSQLFLPPRASVSDLIANAGQSSEIAATTTGLSEVRPAEFNGDLRHLKPVPSKPHEELELQEPEFKKTPPAGEAKEAPSLNVPMAAMPSPLQNFAGLSRTDSVTGGAAGAGTPPDINGDVGRSHYIEAVNDAYGIYSKTGTLLAAFTENSLFSSGPTGTVCDTDSFGDPVVVYDQFNDRWILSNFAFVLVGANQVPPTYQCFAVSKTSDPVSGGWWLYAVRIDTNAVGQPPTGTLGDYEKFGNWNDGCLYMAANGFSSAGAFVGIVFASFNKAAMEAGAPLSAANSSLGFAPGSSAFALIPSNLSGAKTGASLPPAGTPNYFVSESQTLFAYEVRKFTPGAGCGTGGTLGAAANVSQASYSAPNNIAQPNVTTTLDSLGDRLMQKAQYRRVGAAESLWVVHTARAAGSTNRPQWAQINVTGGTVVSPPVQQQIYAPDTTLHRWMASIAADNAGNVALGYSTSNGTSPNFPSIAYSGRLVGDALNQLPQTEVQLQAGGGSQNHTCGGGPCARWGDYTAMSVDPADDCTFWYTNEYYDTQANGNTGNWHTRIGSFKFPTCNAPTAAPATISGSITTAAGSPQPGVTVQLSGARSATATTDSNGNYQFDNVDTGSFYTLTPTLVNYQFSPGSRSFSLLANKTDAVFTAVPDAAAITNPIDANEYFVQQQYLDFLGREPDQGGFDFWVSKLTQCLGNAVCLRAARVEISAAFFKSPEFEQTGGFVCRLYQAGLGRPVSYAEFAAARRQVRAGAEMSASKADFVAGLVENPEFTQRYLSNLSEGSYIDAVLQTVRESSGVDLTSERGNLLANYEFGRSRSESRALVLQQLAEETGPFSAAAYNSSFVLMEYYGYLQRGSDPDGYDFWLRVLNNSSAGNYRGMVCSFLTSAEYQRRFGSVVTRSNVECGH